MDNTPGKVRKANSDIIEEICVKNSFTNANNGSSSCFVLLQDIQEVFPDALQFNMEGHPIPFLLGPDGDRIEPPRIAFYPYQILDIITEVPQSSSDNGNSNSNSSSIIHLPILGDSLLPLSNLAQPSNYSHTVHNSVQIENISPQYEETKELLPGARERNDKILEVQNKMLEL
ncbi:hypothetical protein BX616_009114 [Lobosporangium transversale]|nr:hypothetical protein BX616_009114 [Lobosporangium transversale]